MHHHAVVCVFHLFPEKVTRCCKYALTSYNLMLSYHTTMMLSYHTTMMLSYHTSMMLSYHTTMMLSHHTTTILCACMRACGATYYCFTWNAHRHTRTQEQQQHSQRLITTTNSTNDGDFLTSVSPHEQNVMSRYDDNNRAWHVKT
jgi:hypothetical protein